MSDHLTRALDGVAFSYLHHPVEAMMDEDALDERADCFHLAESLAAFLTDPSNAPLLLGIPVVKALVDALKDLQPMRSSRDVLRITGTALAPFAKTGEDQ